MMVNKFLELYFHIPFCMSKCLYCDFLSASFTEAERDAYMKALFLETRERAGEYRDYQVCSIFIGGGTPSVVQAHRIEELLEVVREQFQLTEDVEISMEVNPGTVDREKLLTYRRAGINRLSMGLQSAQNQELKVLGRIHSYEEFLGAYTLAREVGFTNLNVDVMSALPGQKPETYRDTLEKVLALKPEHISAYSLIVEEGTPFYRLYEQGRLELPDEDTERQMYEETERLLGQQGYHRYEISNYALPGRECRHNIGYWQRREYLGLGLGAASLIGNKRFRNGTDLQKYISAPLEQYEEVQELSLQEQMEETLYLGLRMTKGVSVSDFQRQFGYTLEEVYGHVIQKNIRDGLLEYHTVDEQVLKDDSSVNQQEQWLTLTARGLDLSNYVMAQFLLD